MLPNICRLYCGVTFISDCPSASNTSDSYSDIGDSLTVCEIQEQAATTSLPITRVYADMRVSTNAYSKPLYLRCSLDTTVNVSVMPVSVYKNCFMNTT